MDAWRRIEEQASATRQEKRMEKENGNVSVAPKVAVELTKSFRSPCSVWLTHARTDGVVSVESSNQGTL